MQVSGNVELRIIEQGKPERLEVYKNLVVNTGLNAIRDAYLTCVRGTSTAGWVPRFVWFGSDSTPVSSTQVALTAGHSIDGSLINKITRSSNKIHYQAFIAADSPLNGFTSQEMGMFGGEFAGFGHIMMARVVISELVKTNKIQLVATWTITLDSV